MPPRANPTITMMVSQAQQKMRELKELQFFGGDSLNLKRWSQVITPPADSSVHCYRLVITPVDPNTMMPFSVQLIPNDIPANTIGGFIEAVHRTDDSYEYLAITNQNFGGTRTTKIKVEYSGAATFSLTQIG